MELMVSEPSVYKTEGNHYHENNLSTCSSSSCVVTVRTPDLGWIGCDQNVCGHCKCREGDEYPSLIVTGLTVSPMIKTEKKSKVSEEESVPVLRLPVDQGRTKRISCGKMGTEN
jgi:hypothetical protein